VGAVALEVELRGTAGMAPAIADYLPQFPNLRDRLPELLLGGGEKMKSAQVAAAASHELEQYRREAQVLAKFDHENIVRVHDIGQSAKYPVYIVSPFVEGLSLNQIVRGLHDEKEYRYITRLIQFLAQALTGISRSRTSRS
jgi:serine/threonine protein kinase